MESLQSNGWLPDVNVWLALCSDRHEHHPIAFEWLQQTPQPIYFCRVTQMALLRLLTNSKVMGTDILTPQQAIGVYRELRSDDRVHYAHEPAGIEELWMSLMTVPSAMGSVWTDAWLAAFALSHGSKLVSFDGGMRRWANLEPAVLGR
ncbi:MAG TPA: TA system VapC family ribonuclease toxin [Bryobacteraceae bacterium]|nr:TA system VapC family ribonuclease toxin [Bryobacteraceae bacterium]